MSSRLSPAFRAVRIRRGWRQEDVARKAGVSRAALSMAERGQIEGLTLGLRLRIDGALEIRVDVVPRWRGGDLDRLLDARHAALGERVATYMARFPGWALAPEVSFAIWAERGRVDILAWHVAPHRRLKTEIVDVQEMLGTLGHEAAPRQEDRGRARLVPGERQRVVDRRWEPNEPETSGRSSNTARGSLPGRAPRNANVADGAGPDRGCDEFLANCCFGMAARD